ncbi:MAG TPA: hypothetical protein VER96_10235 [Polyangiaceae bacterium]|nr:hypothetical protein [Polyangiaceae bacterium]
MKDFRFYVLFSLFGMACSSTSLAPDSTTDRGSASASGPAEAATESEGLAEAILTIEVGPEHTFAFYELGDQLLGVETAKNGVPSALEGQDLTAMTPTTLYQKLRPGEAVPAELTAAIYRANAAHALTHELPGDPVSGGGFSAFSPITSQDDVGKVTEAISANTFINVLHGCAVSGSNVVFSVCRTDWMNGYFAFAIGKTASWKVASQNGSFKVKISNNVGSPQTFAIAHDTSQNFFTMGELCCPIICFCDVHPRTLRLDVIDAIGDTFHVGGYWTN